MIITPELIRSTAPAVYADDHAMSSRYGQVRTCEAMAILADHGFMPVEVSQDQPRRRDPMHVTHKVVLRHVDFLKPANVGEVLPQFTLTNSHNGRTKLRLYAGLHRLICSNGLVVAAGSNVSFISRHNSGIAGELAQFLEAAAPAVAEQSATIDRWGKIELNKRQRRSFAKAALKLRFGHRADAYDVDELLTPRREADAGYDLWRTFNVVQEHTTKGGLTATTATGRRAHSGALTAILPEIAFNRDLWTLAAGYANN